MSSLGPLVPEDELLVHQVTETFATPGQTDLAWTEKVWATASAPDGSLQCVLGLGKYPNRGVMDAAAGVSRGTDQWTVRASRELGEDATTVIGPVTYEVLEPLGRVRFTLAPTDVVGVSFDLVMTGAVPAALEEREVKRGQGGRRIDSDIVRFHQIGVASGWVEVDGERTTFDDWTGTRDRSWGVRYMVGAPVADLPRARRERGTSLTFWSPVLMTRPDGSRYGLHVYLQSEASSRGLHVEFQGGVEEADGSRTPFVAGVPDLHFDPANRRLVGGALRCTEADGSVRELQVETVGQTGFHLSPAGYFSWEGHWHGQWRGPLHVEGEHIADCHTPEVARRVHQMRDTIIRVTDPVGGGVGIGNAQTIVMGGHPGTGLSDDGSFF